MKLNLPQGTLELTSLRKGELLLGELVDGEATAEEITSGLERAGIKHGLIRASIQQVAKGVKGQIPLAASVIQVHPAQVKLDYMDDRALLDGDPLTVLTRLHEMPISGTVMAGDRLLTLVDSSKRIRLKPNGNQTILDQIGPREIDFFSGKNVEPNTERTVLIAKQDGLAQRSSQGVVSVYPIESYRNISKAHKVVVTEHSMLIERDILKGARIDIPASAIVRGIVRPSHLEIGGDLDARLGLDNPSRGDETRVRVGASVRAAQIRRFKVWAGGKVLVHRIIDQSEVTCFDTIACPRIAESEIAVGNRLITNSIVRDCEIRFGAGAVQDEQIERFRNKHTQHSRRHRDIHLQLLQSRTTLERLQEKAAGSLQTLRSEGQSPKAMVNVLRRYLLTMEESLKNYISQLESLVQVEELVEREQAELTYYDTMVRGFEQPEVLVLGRLDKGTRFIGPVDELVTQRMEQNVRIDLDPETQKVRLTQRPPDRPLDDEDI